MSQIQCKNKILYSLKSTITFCISIKYNITLNMTDTFLSAILGTDQSRSPLMEKSQLLKRLEQVYQRSLNRITDLCPQENIIQAFQDCYQQLKETLSQQTTSLQSPSLSIINSSRTKSISDDPAGHQQSDPAREQQLDPALQQYRSQYLFLRNAWQSKQQRSQNYDPQDHIDRINKVVAMVRMRTNYMIRKQAYIQQKEESVSSYVFEHPIFMKMKEELERITMRNQELLQRCSFNEEIIATLEAEKSTLLQSLTNMKKKFQQMEKSFIQISKKNICLQQDSLALKAQNSKSKLNSMRQTTEPTNNITDMDLRRSTSFNRFAEEIKTTQRSTEPSQRTINPNIPLENVFIDISLNPNSNREQKQSRTTNNRYVNKDLDNQDSKSVNGNRQMTNKQNENLQVLALCRSERLINDDSQMKLKYIRNHNNPTARKSLLSSAKSVDIANNTSLTKPKFERTKPNYQQLLKSVNKDDCVLIDSRGQKPSLLKKHNILNDKMRSSKPFRNIQENVMQREEVD